MIKATTDFIEKGRMNDDANRGLRGIPYGSFVLKSPFHSYLFIVAAGGDPDSWAAHGLRYPIFEHVSVSVNHSIKRIPTWDEMNWVKDLFWEPEELVVQYHPPKSQYVNRNPWVLHLWKPVGVEIPLPPMVCV
jgi:hypothetical protein